MEDLHLGHFSIAPEYIKAHQDKVEADLNAFANKIKSELKSLENENKAVIDKYFFDKSTGQSYIQESKLSPSEKRLKEIVTKRFSFANFFITEKDKIKNRNEIYYATFSEEPRILQVIKLCMFLDTSLAILQGIKKEDFTCDNFIIASLFDDVRYKFILLYEDVLDNDIDLPADEAEKLVNAAIVNYYNYLLGVPQLTIAHSQMLAFVKEARRFIIDYIEKFNKASKAIRKYKEADVPIDNLLLISKLKRNLPDEEINVIIGIRFGGIELPYLIKHYIFPDAKIKHLKISKYSSTDSGVSEKSIQQFVEENKIYLRTRNVLIVDDSITTGRTAEAIISALRNKTRNIYFSCVYHPEAKRIPHMKMEGHGGVNLDELKKCCVLKEANYTASANMQSYLGPNKTFDKGKEKIKKRLEKSSAKLKVEPVENVVKNENTKKVFIACSQSMVASSYNHLLYIRSYFDSKSDYQILDDWIDGPKKRIQLEEERPQYKEIDGRDFLNEALVDIRNSDIVVLYYPTPSTYLSLLFRIAELSDREIWIFYSHKEDIKGFEVYPNKKLYQIKQLKTLLV